LLPKNFSVDHFSSRQSRNNLRSVSREMSSESPPSEVKPSLEITQTVNAADTHDQRTYTNVPTEATSAHGKHHGGGKWNKLSASNNQRFSGNKKRQNSHHNSESRVKDVVEVAKKTVDDALKGSKGSNKKHRNRNRRSTSGENELSSLRIEG
jgi:hypothetical protein